MKIDLSYQELKEKFREVENYGNRHIFGYIVFTEDSFLEHYSEEARTYIVSSDNKAFKPCALGYSIYGSAIDGSDNFVRLDWYMADEKAGENGWKIERCYVFEEDRKVIYTTKEKKNEG